MIAVVTSLAPGTQWSHSPMVRLPAALALRTNGAETRPTAAPAARTLRRDSLLDCMALASLKTAVHAAFSNFTLRFSHGGQLSQRRLARPAPRSGAIRLVRRRAADRALG